MSDSKTPDEQPKKAVARSVVTEKKMYFVPEAGRSVEADSAEKAGEKALKDMENDDNA